MAEQFWISMQSGEFDQRLCRFKVLPASRQDPETLFQEHGDRRITLPQFVVPWADNDIFRDQVDSRSGPVSGGFPLSKIVLLAVNQPIAPHQHLDVTLTHKVSVNFVEGLCKEYANVFALRRWREFRTQQKDLIHADVKGVGPKRVNDLVHQLEDDSPDLWVKRVPFAAIDTFVIGKRSRRQVEGWVDAEEGKSFSLPGLMTERLKLRNQPDVELLAERRESSCSIACNRICSSPKFRMRLEREVVVNLENNYVKSLLRQVFKILPECIECTVAVVVEEV